MRNIKFRVWLNEIKTMQYSDKLSSFFKDYEGTNIPMMQYTGQKDKNGVEIYESDIVEYHGKRGVVFMRFGCWFVELQRELGYYNHSVAIVGNIHEQEPHT